MMRRKSSFLREWAANGRFDAANTCWHWHTLALDVIPGWEQTLPQLYEVSQHWVKNNSSSLSQVSLSSVGWGTLDFISLLYMKDNHDIVGYADRHCGILPIFAICPPGQPSNIACIQRQKSCGNNTFGVFRTSTSLKATSKFIITPECTSWCF